VAEVSLMRLVLFVLCLVVLVTPAVASDGIGRLVILDDSRVEAILPDGDREVIVNPELVRQMKALLPIDGKAQDGEATAGIGSKIIAAIKLVIGTSVKIAKAMKKGAVVGWEFGNKFNNVGGNQLVGGAVAFFLGAKAFLLLTGGTPIAAVIGGAVMALGGVEVAKKLKVVFNLVFALGGVAVGAAQGAVVYVLLPTLKATLRLVGKLLKGAWELIKDLLHAARHATGEAYKWVKAQLREVRRALVGAVFRGGKEALEATRMIAEIDAVLAL
jgi:hypothetical protein